MRYGLGSRGGRGWAMCPACGFKVEPEARVYDQRQGGWVHEHCADITPGFGTRHPRERIPPMNLRDPSPIAHAAPDLAGRSFQDLGISDAQRLAMLLGLPFPSADSPPDGSDAVVVTDDGAYWVTDEDAHVSAGAD